MSGKVNRTYAVHDIDDPYHLQQNRMEARRVSVPGSDPIHRSERHQGPAFGAGEMCYLEILPPRRKESMATIFP